MAGFFASGHAVDLVLLVIVVEFAVLSLRRSGGTATWLDRVLALAPGVCLLLALRVALTGGPWWGVAAAVTLSLPFHLVDVARRTL